MWHFCTYLFWGPHLPKGIVVFLLIFDSGPFTLRRRIIIRSDGTSTDVDVDFRLFCYQPPPPPNHTPPPPVRTPGVKFQNTSSVSPACRKRWLKGRRYIVGVRGLPWGIFLIDANGAFWAYFFLSNSCWSLPHLCVRFAFKTPMYGMREKFSPQLNIKKKEDSFLFNRSSGSGSPRENFWKMDVKGAFLAHSLPIACWFYFRVIFAFKAPMSLTGNPCRKQEYMISSIWLYWLNFWNLKRK